MKVVNLGLKLLVLLIAVLFIGVSLSDQIKIPFVNLLGPVPVAVNFVGSVPKDQAISITESLKTAALQTIPSAETLEGICSQSPWCDALDFKLNLMPRTLVLSVYTSNPEFVVDYGKDRWLVSNHGELIQTVSSIQDPSISIAAADLPLIQFASSNLAAGSVAAASTCARAVIAATSSGVGFEQFLVEGEGNLRAISSGSEFPPIQVDCHKPSQLREQIARAVRVAKDLQARGEVTQSLDLRTENQVIVK